MAKNQAPQPVAEEVKSIVDAGPVAITLDEFCTRHSKTDRRVELIGAFHFDETRSGRTKDLEDKYLARFEAFATQPV